MAASDGSVHSPSPFTHSEIYTDASYVLRVILGAGIKQPLKETKSAPFRAYDSVASIVIGSTVLGPF